MARLQLPYDSYGLDRQYDSIVETLPYLPAVSRCEHRFELPLPLVEELNLPSDMIWSRQEYIGEPNYESQVRKGNFNGGETIQISAAEESLYQLRRFVPLRDIESASSPQNYQMLREWVDTCTASHEVCRRPRTGNPDGDVCDDGPIMPARLVDVGSLEDLQPRLRLVGTEGMRGKYLCLSHRWEKEPKLQTKRSNIERYRKEIPLDYVPPTFRDAFEVTRQLGYRYLWIDTLCILQDDEDDWKSQSEKMGDIFESSSCTIAAVDAIDIHGHDHGLFLPRHSDTLAVRLVLPFDKIPLVDLSEKVFKTKGPAYVWKYKWLKSESSDKQNLIADKHTVTLRPRIVSLYKKIYRSEWYNRGWVLQERVLSPRMIYYTKAKMYWSCFATTGEEEGGDPTSATRDSLYSMITERGEPQLIWTDIVSEYVRCNLSLHKDRLAAINGLSQKLQGQFPIKIYAGILDEEKGEGLLWYTHRTPLPNFADFHAPSWSWSSLDGVISLSMRTPKTKTSSSLIRNLEFQTETRCEARNPNGLCAGTCTSGRVSFTCKVGELYRCGKFKEAFEGYPGDPFNNDDIMELVLGSAVRSVGHPLRRFNADGSEISQTRQLFVPDHTELLKDQHSFILGFFIPDMHTTITGDVAIICAGIRRWDTGTTAPSRSPPTGSRPGTKYHCPPEVDFIGLQLIKGGLGTYRRIGCGRVICNSWLSTCKEMRITIV